MSRNNYGWQSLGPVSGVAQDIEGVLVTCGDARLRVAPLDNGVIRVRLAPTGVFGRDFSWAVTAPPPVQPNLALHESDETIIIRAGDVRVRIDRNPCRLTFLDAADKLIARQCPSKGLTWDGEEVRGWMSLDAHDHFFGLGEKGNPLDKRHTATVNWNTDTAEHDPWTDPLYQTHPFVLVVNDGVAFGLFFDNTYRSYFDFGKTSRSAWSFGADGGELNYYLIPGPRPADVVRRYAALVGTMPLPPLWSLGYQQCRWSYPTAKHVRQVARQFRRRKIPCDTVYVDIDYMDAFRCFTWNAKSFPRPDKLMKNLAADGFKVVAIVDPGIKCESGYDVFDEGVAGKHFCEGRDGKPYVGKVWPGETVYPDFTRPQTRRWWGQLNRRMTDVGVRGIWNDMNEPADFSQPDGLAPLYMRHDNEGQPSDHRGVHNIYGMQMARSTYEGLREIHPGERPFVLTRAGYSGVQRFAATWTGDNLSSWEHLRMSIPMLLNMNLSGMIFCGADVGGFRDYPSPELFTRWVQLGIFYPLCRVHTAGGPSQDPWSFGPAHEKIMRRAIELRYRLLPYLYSEMRHAAQTGEPVMRPLVYDFPDHRDVHKAQYEFLFGRQILVAPVVRQGETSRRLRLPKGDWYAFDGAQRHAGEEEFELPIRLGTIPMFATAGAVIPMREVLQYADQRPLRELILHVYPGSGGGCFYNDDGISFEHRSGAFCEETYETTDCDELISLRVAGRTGRDQFAPASYLIQFHGIKKAPVAVAVGEQPLPQRSKGDSLRKPAEGWSHDAKKGIVAVRVRRIAAGDAVELLKKASGGSTKDAGRGQSQPAAV